MRPINKRQIALLHVAKNKLGLDDFAYRTLLMNYGVETSKKLTHGDFKSLMQDFKKLGFESNSAKTAAQPAQLRPRPEELTGARRTGSPFSRMTDEQSTKIWYLWKRVTRAAKEDEEKALNSFVRRQTKGKISHWKWMRVGDAQTVIIALEAMDNQRATK